MIFKTADMIKNGRILMVFAIVISSFIGYGQTKPSGEDIKMKTFVNRLMKQMNQDEKLGQLNLPAAGDITTGQAASSDIALFSTIVLKGTKQNGYLLNSH